MNNTATLEVIELSNIRKNIMGTTSFDMKYKGMRKMDDFIVYPMSSGATDATIRIQSGSRFGKLDLSTGKCVMAVNRGGCNSIDLMVQEIDNTVKNVLFSASQCAELKSAILGTYSHHAGTNGIMYSDNSGVTAII